MRNRFFGLDGLRGIAAVVVLLAHSSYVFPRTSAEFGWVEAIRETPLQIFFAGTEAVMAFFIISGFVLAIPAASGKQTSWLGYYPKRILRLYVPVLAAVGLSLVLFLLVPRVTDADATAWMNMHATTLDAPGIVREVVLLSGVYNSVLWSLFWEVIFSLLLPVYLWAARKVTRGWLPGILGMLGLSHVGTVLGYDFLVLLPMFGIGVLLAFALPDLRKAYDRWTWLGPVSFLGGGGVLCLTWTLPAVTGRHVLSLTGCCLIVVSFALWKQAERVGTLNPVQWLGSRSFSLYLVHEPIVVSAALIFDDAPWLAVAVSIPAAIAVTELFFRLVEKPSMGLAERARALAVARSAKQPVV